MNRSSDHPGGTDPARSTDGGPLDDDLIVDDDLALGGDLVLDEDPSSADGPPPGDDRFGVLFVCAANLCRSPTAETLLRRNLVLRSTTPDPCWAVSSAGLDVRRGAQIPRATRRAMAELNLPVDTVPRAIDSSMIEAAGVVLTAERHQRARIVQLVPSAIRKTFTIRQFARLCAVGRGDAGVSFTSSGAELLQIAAVGQSLAQPVDPSLDDIADPTVAATSEAMVRCAYVIAGCIRDITGPDPVGTPSATRPRSRPR